ncbi:putative Voltage-dependent anion channel [Seiridium cardinale]|uniref:Voltage-dependent anion channel n=1 Tax=Seiridium cardinale TaxID=138064 RepID=A0ABR2XAF9_9PEZI
MSTGAMASLLSQQPFTFRGLQTIGKVVFILDIVLVIILTSMMLARFALKPRAITKSLHHPSESFFFGAFWVSLALVLYGMAAYGIPGLGNDNEWLVRGMRVLFWMYIACAMLVAVFQYYIIFHEEKLDISEALPAWILPAYPFLVSGPLAAQVAKTQSDLSATQIIIGGICGQGLGWMVSLLMYSVFYARLIQSDMPAPSVRPGMYVSVGPAAYTCAGLFSLSQQARGHIPGGFAGITSVDIGEVWLAMALPVGLFLWMFAVWFSALTTVALIRDYRRMEFSLQWWAFVFPNAGLAIATIQIGNVLDSNGIRGVAAGLTVILCVMWIVCAVMHIRALWRHDVLYPDRDEGVDTVNEGKKSSS